MTKLISQIDAFERLAAKAAKLKAEGIGPADRKPRPRPPMPPTTFWPERTNIFEGKEKANPLSPEKLKEQDEKLKDRIKEPKEPKKEKPVVPTGPVDKMSPKERELNERLTREYFQRQQEKLDLDAKQRAKSEKMKQRYMNFIKKNDPGSFIAEMKRTDPEFNAEEYLAGLKKLKEESKAAKPGAKPGKEKFVPEYSVGLETEKPEEKTDPSTFTHGDFEISTFVKNLNDDDLDVYSIHDLKQIAIINNLTREEAVQKLSEQGKYLLRQDRWVVTPTPVIERAADALDMDPRQLERFVADIPDQKNMPLSVNRLVEMYLENRDLDKDQDLEGSFEEG